MKLTTDPKTLTAALLALSAAPGVVAAIPASNAVIFTADEFGGTTLRRTTGNACITAPLESAVETAGQAGVDFDLLATATANMVAPVIVFELTAGHLLITAGRTEADLWAYPPEELLPAAELTTPLAEFAASAAALAAEIDCALPAASTAEAEPQFCGVCYRTQTGKRTAFALDRRRVHLVYAEPRKELFAPDEKAPKNDKGFVLTAAAAQCLRKLLPAEDCRVACYLKPVGVCFEIGETVAHLPITEQTPPDISIFLAQEPADITGTCAREELLRACRAANPLGLGDAKVIGLRFAPGAITAETDNEKGAAFKSAVDAKTSVPAGGEEVFRANGQYLIDLLQAARGETVEFLYLKARGCLIVREPDRFFMLALVRDNKSTAS